MLLDFMKDVPILRMLTDIERLTITDALVAVTFAAGQNIINEGEEGDSFYIIEEVLIYIFIL